MNWLRARLRQWLGIDPYLTTCVSNIHLVEERVSLAWERIVAMEVEHSALSKKQAEVNTLLQEVRQLREMLADPKRQPIPTRTTHQFRTLMESD
jgi:hypothetical protein